MTSPISGLTVTSLGQFMTYLEEHCVGEGYLFRGQREEWPLTPKLARLRPRDGDLLEAEGQMLDELQRQAPPWLEIDPLTTWDWLAIAQHHGMATRLLDWTTNPLAALWFVVERPARDGAAGVLWNLFTENIPYTHPSTVGEPFALGELHIFRPRHIARRIVSQTGWFTAHAYSTTEGFLPLENNPAFTDLLTKVSVPASAFSKIRWELDRCGINAASIYPGLDGLCQHLQWLHSHDDDEQEEIPR